MAVERQQQVRLFSYTPRSNFSKKEDKAADYEAGFEEMLNQGKVSEEQKAEFEQRR